MISGREMHMTNDVHLHFTDKQEIFVMLQKINLVQKPVNFVLFLKGLKKNLYWEATISVRVENVLTAYTYKKKA